jgi:hypothetical protein
MHFVKVAWGGVARSPSVVHTRRMRSVLEIRPPLTTSATSHRLLSPACLTLRALGDFCQPDSNNNGTRGSLPLSLRSQAFLLS